MQGCQIPTSRKEVEVLGWNYIDVILFSGDAYVDHPSFGVAILARVLEDAGYRVAVKHLFDVCLADECHS